MASKRLDELTPTVFCSAPASTETPATVLYSSLSALVPSAISVSVGAVLPLGTTIQWNNPGSFSSTTRLKPDVLISVTLGNPATNVGGVSSAVVKAKSVTAA